MSEENNGVAVEEQDELIVVPTTPLGKAARAYLKVHNKMKDTVATLKTEKGEAQEALLAAMAEAKRESITVDGYLLKRIPPGEEEKISVKSPKVE